MTTAIAIATDNPLENCAIWCARMGAMHFDEKSKIRKAIDKGGTEADIVANLLENAEKELIDLADFNEELGVNFENLEVSF